MIDLFKNTRSNTHKYTSLCTLKSLLTKDLHNYTCISIRYKYLYLSINTRVFKKREIKCVCVFRVFCVNARPVYVSAHV
jgi:hypothetical protein